MHLFQIRARKDKDRTSDFMTTPVADGFLLICGFAVAFLLKHNASKGSTQCLNPKQFQGKKKQIYVSTVIRSNQVHII
jgi:heme/copper-type cytochrome/quinol oxidase subunit 2